jgi:1-acyl-sn-glycerol-3-phosphate acyltransferase
MKAIPISTADLIGGVSVPASVQVNYSSNLVCRAALVFVRTTAVLFFSLCAVVEIALEIIFTRPGNRLETRAAWLHEWCRFACRVLGVRTNVRGNIPNKGLLVCNHLSYLDIVVLSATTPCVFVAKSDVRRWPLFGWLARSGGAIFVNRCKKVDAADARDAVRDAIKNGTLVVLFPEGTSSDGSTVLPFKSALFEPAVVLGSDVSAGAIDYVLPGGSVADEVCYWRDMTLVPHLFNLFGNKAIQANVVFAQVKSRMRDRKIVAREARETIIGMRS